MKTKKNEAIFICFIVLFNICRNFLWLLPSALMSPIMTDLNLNYTQVGFMSIVVTVFMGVFLICGSMLLQRLGSVRIMTLGILCFAIDGLCTCFASTYPVIMIGKLFCGIGYGLTTCGTTALIAEIFPHSRLGFANGLNACITSLTVAFSFQLIAPLYEILGSWKLEAGIGGTLSLCACMLFYGWGRSLRSARATGDGKTMAYSK